MSTNLNVEISASGTSYEGQMYSLTCSPTVSTQETISRISWHYGNNELVSTTTESTLTHIISSLTTADSGQYICEVQVTLIDNTLTKIAKQDLQVASGKLLVIFWIFNVLFLFCVISLKRNLMFSLNVTIVDTLDNQFCDYESWLAKQCNQTNCVSCV